MAGKKRHLGLELHLADKKGTNVKNNRAKHVADALERLPFRILK